MVHMSLLVCLVGVGIYALVCLAICIRAVGYNIHPGRGRDFNLPVLSHPRQMTADPPFLADEYVLLLLSLVLKVDSFRTSRGFLSSGEVIQRAPFGFVTLLAACSSYHDGTLEHALRNQRPPSVAIADGSITVITAQHALVAGRSTFTTELTYRRTMSLELTRSSYAEALTDFLGPDFPGSLSRL
jgi:hypothetical protein